MTRFRKVMERLAKGSSALTVGTARGITAWLKAGEKVSDYVVRVIFLTIPGGVLWGLLSASRAFMWLLVVIWCIAAWRAAQPAQEKSEAKEPDLHPDDLADLLWELAGDRKGVHLSQVAQQLTKETPGRTWSVKDVRRLMEAAGIPTRHSVRVQGIGVAVGVHRQDIPGSPSPAPVSPSPQGVEPQVNPATATATTPYVRDLGGGATATFTPDPQQPNRTHVTVVRPTED
ncbi:hypothetical protein AQJ43_23670 [Streptomyces avermitilis]|nr:MULTISPECIES: hypothetical protein [Streptomyces]KUN52228.1 hypothetical protein AQJ43_23670 [Streptomyces avermitilis]MYT01110.1 hypothetical protein [Streptomyces sp. SID5469]OOV30724.1 hypothetical protein SM007_16100 [Streptomyces avermitilis]GDY74092.1 hypothetical protein SAV31267_035770 [Streptomyces avermitilis]